ncbi:MAG: macro domain-containing protein, partial [Planctomycetota bacterium]
MLTYVIGDLLKSPALALVNTVNTVGVMGKGIAKDFKKIYPKMFKEYQRLCETKKLTIGKLWLYKTPNKWILSFPTKTTWRKPSRIDYIKAGLEKFVSTYHKKGITSIAFPQLGCGNGELDWESQVQPLMEKYLKKLPIDVFVYAYAQKDPLIPEHRNINEIRTWLESEPESLGFEE